MLSHILLKDSTSFSSLSHFSLLCSRNKDSILLPWKHLPTLLGVSLKSVVTLCHCRACKGSAHCLTLCDTEISILNFLNKLIGLQIVVSDSNSFRSVGCYLCLPNSAKAVLHMNLSSYCHVSQTVESSITLPEQSGARHLLSFYLPLVSYRNQALSSLSLASVLNCSPFLSPTSLYKERALCNNCDLMCYHTNL